ncbi:MAG: efflux RND transporter periplasmic adaptor subunit [Gemmatimonadota bacterium]
MTRKKKFFIGFGIVLVLALATAMSIANSRERGVEVRMEEVARRDLTATVTTSGSIRARRSVDISSDVMGRVTAVNVKEGEDVVQGQVLLRLDPSQLQASVARAQAALSQAEAQAVQQRANVLQAQREYDRVTGLQSRDASLVSRQQVEDSEIRLEIAQANLSSASFAVAQAEASLDEIRDQLSKTTIVAPISGKVTRLNIEEGETAVVGTMNNPGSLLLTISDLSVIEAVMAVDETSLPEITIGDSANIRLDAFPGRDFAGFVTEIGNSAIRASGQPSTGAQAAAVDFEVILTLSDPEVTLRPDLSATADIVTARRTDALSIPIIALAVRDRPAPSDTAATGPDGDGASPAARTAADTGAASGSSARRERDRTEEGVFVVRDGTVAFVPVEVGITGEEYFEVLSGLEEGDLVVSGPYQRIRELEDGTAVRRMEAAGGENR